MLNGNLVAYVVNCSVFIEFSSKLPAASLKENSCLHRMAYLCSKILKVNTVVHKGPARGSILDFCLP